MTVSHVESNLSPYLNKDRIPFLLLALDENIGRPAKLCGAAELKIREMEIYPADKYPEMEYWLGGVYVDRAMRDRRIATRLIEEVIARAKKLGISNLCLQTERLNGGLYTQLGWLPIEEVYYHDRHVLVMKRQL